MGLLGLRPARVEPIYDVDLTPIMGELREEQITLDNAYWYVRPLPKAIDALDGNLNFDRRADNAIYFGWEHIDEESAAMVEEARHLMEIPRKALLCSHAQVPTSKDFTVLSPYLGSIRDMADSPPVYSGHFW